MPDDNEAWNDLRKARVKFFGGCAGFAALLGLISLAGMFIAQEQLGRAVAWDVPQAWGAAECKVVAAGVACVEVDTGSTCGGYGASGSPYRVVDGSLVFDYDAIAVCPGTYWCAKEGSTCFCDGEVAFAAELFNGVGYTKVEPEFRRNASGRFTCGTDQLGRPFKRDPAPYRIKHCWCTPRIILERLVASGGAPAARARRDACAKGSNSEYKGEAGNALPFQAALAAQQGRPAEGGPGRQEAFELEGLGRRRFGNVTNGGGEFPDASQPWVSGQARPMRLASSSPRRRRSFSYTPWAFVEVENHADVFRAHPSGGSALTCAYEFGAPVASFKDFETDGSSSPYWSDDLDAVQRLVEKWASGATAKCFARAQGTTRFARSPDECAVAMEPLSILEGRREQSIRVARGVACGAFAVAALGLAGVRYWWAREAPRQPDAGSEYTALPEPS